MIPSFVTIQKDDDEKWIVVQREYPLIHGQLSFIPQTTVRSDPYESQASAIYKAEEVSRLVRARVMGCNDSMVIIVPMGEPRMRLFLPAILRADGQVIMVGDGMTADLERTVAKARKIAEEQKLPFEHRVI